MKLAISSGHGKYVRGASGYLDEVNEARRVVDRCHQLWNENGVTTVKFHDDTSTSQNQNLNTIVNWHNKQTRDYDISCHFNAYSSTTKPMGTEVWYYSQSSLASKVSGAMAGAGKFINRGGKKSTDLFFLNSTNKPAILLEVCFVDSQADANLYNANFEAICKSIVESVAGITIGGTPIDPPIEPEPPGPEEARLTITTEKTGEMVIVFNSQELVVGENPNTENRVNISMDVQGAVEIFINGQKYNNVEGIEPPGPDSPTFPANQSNIICTVFGGSSDPNSSAYAPYDTITDSEESVALPYKFTDERHRVLVHNDDNGQEVITNIRDVGPWLTDDNYWSYGTRPLAETCYLEQRPLPRGPNAGKIPNGAGCDITPGAAKAIGLSGKGKISWTFVNEEGTPIS